MQKLRIAVHKFSSCDGCQLQLLNLEQDLLTLAGRVEIANFIEATSRNLPGPYDVSLVEGSVSTPDEVERIKRIRAESKVLVAIGACATSGGIQALRNWGRLEAFVQAVYAKPEYIDSLATSTPFTDHVRVDAELYGCPPDQGQLKHVLTDLLAGVAPRVPTESVCMQCKRAGHVCVLVAKGMPCMGPVTRMGCGALCPGQERDCYACFGPQGGSNPRALGRRFLDLGLTPPDVARRYRFIYNWAPAFREAAEDWDANGATYAPLPGRAGGVKP
jgi:coenzyme F420-reducing hydrogenase gamma subunit